MKYCFNIKNFLTDFEPATELIDLRWKGYWVTYKQQCCHGNATDHEGTKITFMIAYTLAIYPRKIHLS